MNFNHSFRIGRYTILFAILNLFLSSTPHLYIPKSQIASNPPTQPMTMSTTCRNTRVSNSHGRLFLASDDSEIDWSDPIIPTTDERIKSRYQKPIPTQGITAKNGGLSVNLIPEKFRSIFPFSEFNAMQSKSFGAIYDTDDNCVISSPTGSGKTVLFEIAIIKLLEARLHQSDDSLLNAKILYMAPTKALCSERYSDWSSKFQPLGCTVGMLTGDSPFVELDSIRKSDLIICTPEKWDVLTRRWADYSKLLNLVKLLLVDEIHFLREKRGTSLEVVITRMITMPLNLRVIALSATVPNINDVAKWLRKSHNGDDLTQATTMVYDDTYRAVSLEKIVYGYQTMGTSNPFKFDGFLNGKLLEVIRLHSKGKPTLIFCSTRNNTISTAKFLLQGMPDEAIQLPNIPHVISKDLIEMVQRGVAYHHAGLSWNERKFVEENFVSGNIKTLCSTSTLAVGVNLPAYLVIVKGTKVWNNSSMEEYNELDLMQMMGRAGRPQFETKGACVIMTDAFNKDRYVKLVKGTENLESSLHLNIFENITAEITLNTITSLDTAFNWLKSTFFYQRYLQNPKAYPTVYSNSTLHHNPEAHLKVFLKRILDELQRERMIEVADDEFESSAYGIAMSKNYVLYDTMKAFIKAGQKLTLQESLILVSGSGEFKDTRIKMPERKLFKEINASPLIFSPIKNNKVEKFNDKISLLIQFELGGVEFPTYQGSMKLHHEFISEKLMVFKNIPRILKAAIEVFSYRKDSISLTSILKLTRCIAAKSWENSSLVLRQFDGVGLAYAKKLMSRGVTSISQLKALPRDKLEYYLGLKPGAGQKIAKSISNMPELSLSIENIKCETTGCVQFTVAVGILNKEDNITFIWNGSFSHINVLTDVSGSIWDFRRLPLKKLSGVKKFNMKVNVKYKTDYIKVALNCDEIAGIGQSLELDISSITDQLQSNAENDPSFDFDDDDEVLNAVFGDAGNNESTVKTSKIFNFNKVEHHDVAEISDISLSYLSTSAESSFTECAHKCSDKNTCRHICCKEGIPRHKVTVCKHVCKDKSKCRHMCCRDQYEYEIKCRNKLERKRMRQNTLDFSKYSNPKKENSVVESIVDMSKENNSFDDNNIVEIFGSADDKKKEKEERPSPESNSPTTAVPVFLRKISKTNQTSKVDENDISYLSSQPKYGKLTTSKYFSASITNPEKSNNQRLLDISDDSDEFSDTFDSAISKALESRKRVRPIAKESVSSKRFKHAHTPKFIRGADTTISSDIELPKLKNVEAETSHLESVEDIVIVNQTLPKAIPIGKIHPRPSHLDYKQNCEKSRVNNEEEDAEESNICYSVEDMTVMTSVMEEAVNKEVFGFLDSDIEFDSL